MKYITHRRYKGPDAGGKQINVRYGTEFETAGGFLATPEGRGICFTTSETAKRHFAANGDGKGLERGALTWAIAYSPRRRQSGSGAAYRFSDEEQEALRRDWARFLRPDTDAILFNEDFFRAGPEELRRMASALNIKIRR